jgi:PAS domain S-box-containing protein
MLSLSTVIVASILDRESVSIIHDKHIDNNISMIDDLIIEFSYHTNILIIALIFLTLFGLLIYFYIKVFKKAKDIEKKEKFLNSILDGQDQIIITTNGRKLQSVNSAFLRFFRVYSLEVFLQNHNCICDCFVREVGCLQPIIDEVDWVTYILQHRDISHKAKIDRDGKRFVFQVKATPLDTGNGSIKGVTFTDISELENKRNEVQNQLTFINELINSVPIPIFYQDQNLKYQYVNEHFRNLMNMLNEQDFQGGTVFDLKIPEIDAQLLHKDDLRLKSKTVKHSLYETKISVLEHGERDLSFSKRGLRDVDDNFSGIIGAIQDITDSKNRERRLYEYKKNITSSIQYASLIQETILPNHQMFRDLFSDFFIIWEPKDIVGGDIYFLEKISKDESLIFVIDCTGHGVPGAFVTMLVKAITQQLIYNAQSEKILYQYPSNILSYFNKEMKLLLNQYNNFTQSNVGFDGAVLYYNQKARILRFSGAETFLTIVQDGEISVIKGDRHSIGYRNSKANYSFKTHSIDISKETTLYLSTDGFIDQNGGEKGFSFGKRNFLKMVENSHKYSFRNQKDYFLETLYSYQGVEERNDDITLLALKI